MSEQTVQLLPCPFCGSADIDPTGWANSEGVEGPVCNNCTASIGYVGRTPEANIAAWNARPAIILAAPDLLKALVDAEYALANIAETFDYDDDDDAEAPCSFPELCGEKTCAECGCIRDKRDLARGAISKATGQTP